MLDLLTSVSTSSHETAPLKALPKKVCSGYFSENAVIAPRAALARCEEAKNVSELECERTSKSQNHQNKLTSQQTVALNCLLAMSIAPSRLTLGLGELIQSGVAVSTIQKRAADELLQPSPTSTRCASS